jgi:hypothetical protein
MIGNVIISEAEREPILLRKRSFDGPQPLHNFRKAWPFWRIRRPAFLHQSSPLGVTRVWYWGPQCVAHNSTCCIKKNLINKYCFNNIASTSNQPTIELHQRLGPLSWPRQLQATRTAARVSGQPYSWAISND